MNIMKKYIPSIIGTIIIFNIVITSLPVISEVVYLDRMFQKCIVVKMNLFPIDCNEYKFFQWWTNG